MVLVCPTCSTENRDGARFCKGCGGKLADLASSPVAPAPQTEWATTAPAPLRAPLTPSGLFDPSAPAPGAQENTVIVAAGVRPPLPPPPPSLPPDSRSPSVRPQVQSAGEMPSEPRRSQGVLFGIGIGIVVALLLAAAAAGWYAYSGRAGASIPVAVAPPASPPAMVSAPAPVAPPEPVAPAAQPLPEPVAVAPALPAAAPAAEPEAAPARPVAAPVAPKPRKVAPLPAAAPVAVAPPPPAPVAIPEPAPPAAPQAACEGRNFIARAQCMAAQCLKAEFKSHPQCDAVRKQQRLEDERRNLY